VNVVDLAPTFERSGLPFDSNRPVIVVHQDFLSLATQVNPMVAEEGARLRRQLGLTWVARLRKS